MRAFVWMAIALALAGFHSGEAETVKLEMRFKPANELEKAARLKQLHSLQLQELDSEADKEKVEQALAMISNVEGTSRAFLGDANSRSSLITVPVAFGGQTFDLTVDTGSTVLWVSSTSCKSLACLSHKSFDASNSTTFEVILPRLNFELEYGSGNIEGYLGKDIVSLGGFTAPSQTFGVVTKEEGGSFQDAQWSGILGLGYPSLAAFENANSSIFEPLFDSLMRQRVLNQNAFSFWLLKSKSSPPMFFLGAPPTQYYDGKLALLKVVDKYYWTLNLHDILVDGTSLGLCPNGCRVAVDSGTAYMAAPKKDLAAILSALTGSSAKSQCQQNLNKTLTYVMDDNTHLTLEPDYYFTKSYDGDLCKVKYVGIDVDPPHGPLHIFGDALFRKYFIHFDRDNDQVGFAVAKREVSPTSQSLQSLILEKLRSFV